MYLGATPPGRHNMTLMDNKRGNIIGFAFAVISFIFIWAVWLGGYLNTLGAEYIAQNNPDMIEYWFYANLNLFVFFGLVIAIFLYLYLGSTQQ